MKVFAIALLVLFATASAAPRDEGDLADAIANIFVAIQKAIPEDSELKLVDATVDIPENDIENGQLIINEVSLSGLKTLEYGVSEDDTETNAKYTLSIDDLVAIIDIDLDVTGLLTTKDRLYIKVDLQSLELKGDFTFTDTDYTELSDYDILISLGASEITVEGVIDEDYSKELSATLTKRVPELVNQIALALEEPVSEILKFAINLILRILT